MRKSKNITKTVTRAMIYKALRTEKLKAGEFFENYSNPMDCNVCAVGAVLKHASFVKAAQKNYSDMDEVFNGYRISEQVCEDRQCNGVDGALELAEEGNYMGALSSYFEGLMELKAIRLDKRNRFGETDSTSVNVTKSIREKCVQFVKDNFPKTIKITMDIS